MFSSEYQSAQSAWRLRASPRQLTEPVGSQVLAVRAGESWVCPGPGRGDWCLSSSVSEKD